MEVSVVRTVVCWDISEEDTAILDKSAYAVKINEFNHLCCVCMCYIHTRTCICMDLPLMNFLLQRVFDLMQLLITKRFFCFNIFDTNYTVLRYLVAVWRIREFGSDFNYFHCGNLYTMFSKNYFIGSARDMVISF